MTQTTKTDQTSTAEILVDLTREDAPRVQWTLDDTKMRLAGHLFADTDTDRRQGLAAWQRVIGAGPVDARPAGATEHLHIHGSYEGVAVHVVTIVAATPAGHCDCCPTGGAA